MSCDQYCNMVPEDEDTMNPMASGQKGSAVSTRPKWTNWIEGKLALLASTNSPADYIAMPLYFFYSGGGLVFIPILLLFLGLVGVPMLLLEVGVGQFMDRGTWCAWNIAPLFKGIGYLMTIMNAQNIWSWLWFLMSEVLFCYDLGVADPSSVSIFSHCPNGTVLQNETPDLYEEFDQYLNLSRDSYGGYQTCLPKGPWRERWEDLYIDFDGLGAVDGVQVLVMLLMVLLVCGICAAGKRVIGKVSALCVILPYLLTLMLFVRVVTIPGASEGIKYGFYPDFQRFHSYRTWEHAALVALYLFAAGRGTCITVGSYNRFNNNFLLDCFIVLALKLVMVIFIACTMLGAFGVVAAAVDRPISDTITGGLMVLPMATEAFLVHTPSGGFWAACFLTSVLLVTLGAALWTAESTVVAIRDLLPRTPRFRMLRKKHVLVAVCAVPWFVWGISYCTKGSNWSVQQLDMFCSSPTMLLLVCLLECAAVGWLYGARRFEASWAAMQGCCCCPYPLIFWAIISPIVLFVLLILKIITTSYIYELASLTSFLFALLLIPISGVILLATRSGTLRQKWRIMTTPWDLAPHQLLPHNRRYDTIAMTTMAT